MIKKQKCQQGCVEGKLVLSVFGKKVSLCLYSDLKEVELVQCVRWEDNRDLTDKLFVQIEKILRNTQFSWQDIREFAFKCDSPYVTWTQADQLSDVCSADCLGKCSFTSWQTGDIVMKVLNFSVSL